MYSVTRNQKYDFAGESYSSTYPNLHKYPATMLPQIGIELFKELGIKGGKLLDPYCGSGSSFTAGLDRGLSEMHGFDINPLALLICKATFMTQDVASDFVLMFCCFMFFYPAVCGAIIGLIWGLVWNAVAKKHPIGLK